MSDTHLNKEQAEYNVKLNSEVAYTLIYGDSAGRLMFVFESGEGQKQLILHRTPLESGKMVNIQDVAIQKWVSLAFDRTKEYLVSHGYNAEPAWENQGFLAVFDTVRT